MTQFSTEKNRSLAWEDDSTVEPRFPRVRQTVPPTGRVLPGMPLETADLDNEEEPRASKVRFGARRNSWWRPAGTFGRALLGLGALATVAGLVTISILLSDFLKHDSRFRIAGTGNIDAVGLTEVSRSEMLPIFGADVGRNIFFVNLDERRRQLEQLPWVEHATVMRLLPDRIHVQVVERQPVAFVRQGQQINLVDANGVLLSMPPALMAQHHYSFPVVTGIDPNATPEARRARMAVYLRLLGELDANGQRLSEQLSEIDMSDPADARVLMPEQSTDILAHFGEDHFFDRYQRYKAHIAEWHQQFPKLAAVDLRYDQQVVLEMQQGSAVAHSSTPNLNGSGDASAAAAPAPSAPSPDHAESVKPELVSASAPRSSTHKVGKVKSASKGKLQKASTKSSAKSKLKAKNASAKTERKRAVAKRAALQANRKKPVPSTRPVEIARQGQ